MSISQQGIGNTIYGTTHTAEARLKISVANTGRVIMQKDAVSAKQNGKIMSFTTRDKISKANLDKIVSVVTQNNLSALPTGKTRNPKSSTKQGITITGKKNLMHGNGSSVTSEKNGIFGRTWYINQASVRLVTDPSDPRLLIDDWQHSKEWK